MSVDDEAVRADEEVVERITLTPDPAMIKSLGTHHTLESAMADLVDNSIDADATTVTIQFITGPGQLGGIVVVDNGKGMDAQTIDRAMRLGGQRAYAPGDLGHFGVGLKAAALGNANVLTVWSKQYGAVPVGRRLRKVDLARDYSCEVLSIDAAGRVLAHSLPSETGTVIVLSEITKGILGDSPVEFAIWLARAQEAVRQHLGLVYHRYLTNSRIAISTVEADSTGRLGSAIPVRAIDPFHYPTTGRPGYPIRLQTPTVAGVADVECHIWPARYDGNTEFRLLQRSGEDLQGFYVYRADRLLQIGGWNGVVTSNPIRRLARVKFDVDGLEGLVQLNPEKSGTQFAASLSSALQSASSGTADDATTFPEFIRAAEDAHTLSKKRQHRRKVVAQPGQGFTPELRQSIGSEHEYRLDEGPVDVKWRRLPTGRFFEIDRASRTLWLNLTYRDLFTPGHKGLNDAPLLKALMFLLTEEHFGGQVYRSTKKAEAETWQVVLGTAAEAERARRRSKGEL